MTREIAKSSRTSSGKPFRYKGVLPDEVIVYPSDKTGQPQERYALVITPYEINLVQELIRQHDRILVGASRDNPPKGSLGAFLKERGLTPQHLSYLIPLLEAAGVCTVSQDRRAFVVERRKLRLARDRLRKVNRSLVGNSAGAACGRSALERVALLPIMTERISSAAPASRLSYKDCTTLITCAKRN
jgi:hypothetical protein